MNISTRALPDEEIAGYVAMRWTRIETELGWPRGCVPEGRPAPNRGAEALDLIEENGVDVYTTTPSARASMSAITERKSPAVSRSAGVSPFSSRLGSKSHTFAWAPLSPSTSTSRLAT